MACCTAGGCEWPGLGWLGVLLACRLKPTTSMLPAALLMWQHACLCCTAVHCTASALHCTEVQCQSAERLLCHFHTAVTAPSCTLMTASNRR